jgi:hypothetical protein
LEDRIEVTLEKMQKEQLENMRRGRNNSKEIVQREKKGALVRMKVKEKEKKVTFLS